MTDIVQLFSGIGIIIDDEITNANSSIGKIAISFKEKHIPYLSYEVLPTDEEIPSFHSASFVLLDWKWNTDASDEFLLNENIYFIKKFHDVCFAPIFIFTNESSDAIINSLKAKGVYSDTKNNLIFVKHKSEIDDSSKLFSAIEEWTRSTLPVYILKEWDSKKRIASNNLFRSLYDINPNWVKIFMETSKKDSVDAAYELNELLFENLRSRISLIDLDSLPETDLGQPHNAQEIREIMQGQRFLPVDKISPNMIFTGDIYQREIDNNKQYYINVRPQCDCIPRGDSTTVENIDLYLIKGDVTPIKDCDFRKKYGNFADNDTLITVFPINHQAVCFKFNNFSVKSFSEMRQYRIGRLLPPFITKLVQKYALYMQRQALPRIPEEAIK